MTDTRLTKVSLARAVHLCLLVVFRPRKLVDEQKADDEARKNFSQPPPPAEHSAFLVRRAFWSSLLLVLSSCTVGYGAGLVIDGLFKCVTETAIRFLQFSGAMLLLWATLFVRGWEIQTHGGVTLTERVNRWLYRALCCVGTALIICSLALSSCPR